MIVPNRVPTHSTGQFQKLNCNLFVLTSAARVAERGVVIRFLMVRGGIEKGEFVYFRKKRALTRRSYILFKLKKKFCPIGLKAIFRSKSIRELLVFKPRKVCRCWHGHYVQYPVIYRNRLRTDNY